MHSLLWWFSKPTLCVQESRAAGWLRWGVSGVDQLSRRLHQQGLQGHNPRPGLSGRFGLYLLMFSRDTVQVHLASSQSGLNDRLGRYLLMFSRDTVQACLASSQSGFGGTLGLYLLMFNRDTVQAHLASSQSGLGGRLGLYLLMFNRDTVQAHLAVHSKDLVVGWDCICWYLAETQCRYI